MIRGLLPWIRGSSRIGNALRNTVCSRGIAASTSQWAKKMPDRPPPIDENEFTEAFLKGTGPGGQKIVSRDYSNWLLSVHSTESTVKG
jgi:hypothetical protein